MMKWYARSVGWSVAQIKGLKLLLPSEACIIPIAGDGIDIYAVAAQMEKRGWNMFTAREPSCMCAMTLMVR